MTIFARFPIHKKLQFMTLLSLLALFLISVFTLFYHKGTLLEDRKIKTQNVVEVAVSVINNYVQWEKEGIMSPEEAQRKALDAVKALRYDGKNYFWINDTHPKMVMHPFKPQLDGKDLSKVTDPAGTPLFMDMVDVIKQDGKGFVYYLWPKPGLDQDKPVQKLSFVQGIPEWGWIIGSGIYIDDVNAVFFKQLIQIGVVIVVLFSFFITIGHFITRDIKTSISRISQNMVILSEGCDIHVQDQDRRDEIGLMARALVDLSKKLKQSKETEAYQKQQEARMREERATEMHKLASDFEAKVQDIIQNVAQSAMHLSGTSEQMSSAMTQSSDKMNASVTNVGDMANNVNSIASAAEEMSMSVKEITYQMQRSNDLVENAVKKIEMADSHAQALSAASSRVEEVVGLISDIAQQVNLLALNATIEAARAGEAGKGFAVVAGEVKNLASQTEASVQEIDQVISEMNVASQDILKSLEDIKTSSEEILSSSHAVASAVSEQDTTTDEIVRNIQMAAQGSQLVSSSINDVSSDMNDTKQSAFDVSQAAQDLSKMSERLRSEVADFVSGLRA
ncbi:MAG: hypothetical protein CL570_07315 [Alphaproteobacteria bacterium]|nr:hypothetical protein [Alphaproteobacteria bacterium]|tara:strand:- start:4702 stop:6393 length:1692 start_codon:yes stop_codon:yes gene_type:complete